MASVQNTICIKDVAPKLGKSYKSNGMEYTPYAVCAGCVWVASFYALIFSLRCGM